MGCLLVVVLGVLTTGGVLLFGYPAWLMAVLGVLWLAALVLSAVRGHHGFGGGGNTDLMIVLAGALITLAVLVPNYAARRPCAQARTALRELGEAEREYFEAHKSYTADLGLLKLKPNPQVKIVILKGDDQSFVATATHPGCTSGKGGAPQVFLWDSTKGGPQN